MSIDLTTDNLRNSCRICLNEGELNIWEHSVLLSDQETFEDIQTYELTAHELFKIYENYDTKLLGLNDDLKLLCYSCLDELTSSYIFYRKAVYSNRQIQRLYKEAEKIDAGQLVEVVVEVLENEDSNECNVGISQDQAVDNEDNTEAEVTLEDYIEQVEYENEEKFFDVNCSSIKTKNNESKTDLNACENDALRRKCRPITADYIDEIRTVEVKQSHNKQQREKAIRTDSVKLPSYEDGSLVVTQFLPSTAHIVLDPVISPLERKNDVGKVGIGENNQSTLTTGLSTVDFAAVEVKRSDLQQVIQEEQQLQNTSPSSPNSLSTIDAYGNKTQMQQSANTVYVCQYCPQAFAAPHYLIAHVRKSHVCKYCTRAFAKSVDLFVHIRQAHHQHKCAICSKELSSHSNLRGHIKRMHGIRLPAQVALLDYRPPSDNVVDEKEYTNTTADSKLGEMDMYF